MGSKKSRTNLLALCCMCMGVRHLRFGRPSIFGCVHWVDFEKCGLSWMCCVPRNGVLPLCFSNLSRLLCIAGTIKPERQLGIQFHPILELSSSQQRLRHYSNFSNCRPFNNLHAIDSVARNNGKPEPRSEDTAMAPVTRNVLDRKLDDGARPYLRALCLQRVCDIHR